MCACACVCVVTELYGRVFVGGPGFHLQDETNSKEIKQNVLLLASLYSTTPLDLGGCM